MPLFKEDELIEKTFREKMTRGFFFNKSAHLISDYSKIIVKKIMQ